jgi:hypothetical protein
MTAWTPPLDAVPAPRASHRVVTVGGGFAGLQAARGRRPNVRVLLAGVTGIDLEATAGPSRRETAARAAIARLVACATLRRA